MGKLSKWSIDGMAFVTYNRLRKLFRLSKWDDLSDDQRKQLIVNAVDIFNEGAASGLPARKPKA
jgi:hypothetical protein